MTNRNSGLRLLLLAAAAVLAVGCYPPPMPPGNSADLLVRVRYRCNNAPEVVRAAANASVTVSQAGSDAGVVASVRTDANGVASFSSLPADVDVTISATSTNPPFTISSDRVLNPGENRATLELGIACPSGATGAGG